MVDPCYDLFTLVYPFVPVPPYERSFVAFLFKQFNAVMQFSHAFSNLLRGLWHS